jgi:hypothetical protein
VQTLIIIEHQLIICYRNTFTKWCPIANLLRSAIYWVLPLSFWLYCIISFQWMQRQNKDERVLVVVGNNPFVRFIVKVIMWRIINTLEKQLWQWLYSKWIHALIISNINVKSDYVTNKTRQTYFLTICTTSSSISTCSLPTLCGLCFTELPHTNAL